MRNWLPSLYQLVMELAGGHIFASTSSLQSCNTTIVQPVPTPRYACLLHACSCVMDACNIGQGISSDGCHTAARWAVSSPALWFSCSAAWSCPTSVSCQLQFEQSPRTATLWKAAETWKARQAFCTVQALFQGYGRGQDRRVGPRTQSHVGEHRWAGGALPAFVAEHKLVRAKVAFAFWFNAFCYALTVKDREFWACDPKQ